MRRGPELNAIELGWRCWDVFDASGDGVLVSDHAGRTVFVNPALVAMSGYTADELLGQPIEMLVPAASRQQHDDWHGAYRAEPYPRMMGHGPLLQLQRRDGSLIPVEIALAPMGTAAGTRTVATVRDVTDRVALRSEGARLLALLDLVPDPVVVFDAVDLRVEYANPAICELTGYPRQEVVGHPIGRVTTNRSDADRRATIDRLTRGESAADVAEAALRTVTGELIPVELHLRLVTDPYGARHVVGVARDQRARDAAEERLRASEAAFRTVFEEAPIGVAVVAGPRSGRRAVILANQKLADMLGCAIPDLLGAGLGRFTHTEDRAADLALFDDLAEGRIEGYSRLRRFRHAGGTEVWAEVRATGFALPDVADPAVLFYLVDVTDRVAEQHRRDQEAVVHESVAEIATAALAGEPESAVLDRIACAAQRLLSADGAALALREPTGGYRWESLTGEPLTALIPVGTPVADIPLLQELRTGATVSLPQPASGVPGEVAAAVGPVAVAPFGIENGVASGFLVVTRRTGGTAYTAAEADDLTRLAAQTQLAVHLARARSDRQRLALLEDRQRIGRDLHDRVLQDIIAVGMRLAAEADREPDAQRRARELERVEELEQIVLQLRRVVFETRLPGRGEPLAAIRALVAESERVLRHCPAVVATGTVHAVPADVLDDLLAVLREALANVARHAQANRTWVSITASSHEVVLTVEDDGVGVVLHPRAGYGIGNMTDRAVARGGTAALTAGAHGGASLTWRCPL